MKYILLVALLCVVSSLAAQEYDYGFLPVNSRKSALPRKFVLVDGTKYALKETEVTIREYLDFMRMIYKDSSMATEDFYLPQTPCILADFVKDSDKRSTNDDLPWFDAAAFEKKYNVDVTQPKAITIYDHPITGLTYEQSMGYALWCTDYYNRNMVLMDEPDICTFRLPTVAEYEKYALKGITKCWEKKKPAERDNFIRQMRECKNEKKCALCNYAGKEVCESNTTLAKKYGTALYPVQVFFPNCVGVYDLQGNAAEMTAEQGKAKGGSYIHAASECQPEAVQNYDAPQAWLGFRLIVEFVNGKPGN
jgi:formylglycine-generating enzyme required for sulfatase activity